MVTMAMPHPPCDHMQSLTSSSLMTSCFSDTILRNSSFREGWVEEWLPSVGGAGSHPMSNVRVIPVLFLSCSPASKCLP